MGMGLLWPHHSTYIMDLVLALSANEVVCQAGPSKSVSFLEDAVTTLEVSGQRAAGWTKNETSVRTAALPDPRYFVGSIIDIPE